jgi:hypothetical protein
MGDWVHTRYRANTPKQPTKTPKKNPETKYHLGKAIFIGTIFLWNVFLFWVIWFTYSSDKMSTLDTIVKDYDKNIVRACKDRQLCMGDWNFIFVFLTSSQDCNSGMQKRIHFRTDMEHNICRLVNNSDVSCRSLQALYLCKRLDFTRFL